MTRYIVKNDKGQYLGIEGEWTSAIFGVSFINEYWATERCKEFGGTVQVEDRSWAFNV